MADTRHPEAEPFFSQPVRQITTMVIVLMLVGTGAYVAYPSVAPVFLANPLLNGFIAVVFLVGVLACFWQQIQLIQSVHWIKAFAGDPGDGDLAKPPRLLAPLAALLKTRGRAVHISPSSARSMLDSVAARIDEARDITRYIVNVLIFLGLLGTFYGLATTVPAIVDTIRSLAPAEGEDGMAVFSRLMGGLESQLGGMGVAFASSLLGLAGSLVVGLLELFAGHGQNRFYRELEEWLSSITRLGYSGADTEADEAGGAAVTAILVEQLVDQVDRLQTMFVNSDVSRNLVDERLASLADSIEAMTRRMEEDGSVAMALARVADGQERLADALEATEGGSLDAESRMRLRSIDVQLLRLLEEVSSGRQESTAELRQEIRHLIRAIGRAGPKVEPVQVAGRRG